MNGERFWLVGWYFEFRSFNNSHRSPNRSTAIVFGHCDLISIICHHSMTHWNFHSRNRHHIQYDFNVGNFVTTIPIHLRIDPTIWHFLLFFLTYFICYVDVIMILVNIVIFNVK